MKKIGTLTRGTVFTYAKKQFIVMEAMDDGVFCLLAQSEMSVPFHNRDDAPQNNYAKSSLRETVEGPWLKELLANGGSLDDMVPFDVDLRPTDQSEGYGTLKNVLAAPLTLWQYGKYKDIIPLNEDDWWWLVTPWACPWLRSPRTNLTGYAWFVYSNGSCNFGNCAYSYGVRPALILPSSLLVSDDGTVTTNTAPTTPSSISVPGSIQGGSTITVSWGASTDAQNNLEGYILERSTDGGKSWSQVYQGSSRSTTNTVAFGTASVMYRVKAYDSEGLSSGYKTSGQVTVINNTAPTAPSSITVPNTVLGGSTLTVTWGAASDQDGNLSGYSLERQVDGGAWSVVYTGNTLSFTDTITKGWAKVCYRVRAYDSNNAYSGYVTSPERAVNNNTAPAIVCSSASGSDLGVKDAGFMVSYSISDVDTDEVTVTEAIDGVTKRTFTATLDGSNSFNVTGEYFMKLLNGGHTLTITANDGKASTVHTLTFTKEVTGASITLEAPMPADAQITICVLSVAGFIPADAEYKVEVTNNANDETPVWEDCTAEVKNSANHIFENKTAANGFAFNFRITAERGVSGEGGYITSVQGGFQ